MAQGQKSDIHPKTVKTARQQWKSQNAVAPPESLHDPSKDPDKQVMDEISYHDQHGFRRGLGIQTAPLPMPEAIRDADLHDTPMQILSVDLKSAFNTISPELFYKVMELEKFPKVI